MFQIEIELSVRADKWLAAGSRINILFMILASGVSYQTLITLNVSKQKI